MIKRIGWWLRRRLSFFPGSTVYWERRYRTGGHSGVGSYGRFARFKADVLNAFVAEHGIRTVLELGCGDGNQLALARYPRYVGFDVSPAAVQLCRARFAADERKSFHLMSDYRGETAELTLSLDVIYHLVEDDVYDRYMRTLFDAATRHVVIYASDADEHRFDGSHIRHRASSAWIAEHRPGWALRERVPNAYPFRGDYREGSFADFFIYERC